MLSQLNDAQKDAVVHIDGPMLILAGAGSGKTKTITTRLAYLLGVVGIDPRNTLTLTFTNKASQEMRARALKLLENRVDTPPLLCTFHKFGLIFLKKYINRLDRDENFVIIDSEDKKRLLRQIVKDIRVDLNIHFLSSEISKYKNSLLSPEEAIEKAELEDYKNTAIVYKLYQENIEDNNLVDFDDLLALPYKILIKDDSLRRNISNYYQYIMVDEYQDTNELQYRLLKILASEHNNLCVVGDDDQSIYGWRGANIRNILEFSQNFQDAKVVKLEVNYRSTQPILEAANLLIEHNTKRVGKRLISHRGDGAKIELLHSLDESLEARNIALKIKELIATGVQAKEVAVLYRINALSRSIEDGFMKEGLNFKLVGGIRFYERAEIKDIISYFRVISNPDDDFSLLRVINKPKRGVGKISSDRVHNFAKSKNLSIFEAISSSSLEELERLVSKKSAKTLKSFISQLILLQKEAKESLSRFVDSFEREIDLKKHYSNLSDGIERVLNIDEFYGYLRDSITNNPSLTLEEFLNDISLQSDQDQLESEAVNIMSIHASKGLEFEHLFVIGLEEEFFPLLGDNCNMEEERRLGYVAITRAKTYLTLCYCDSRFYKGKRKTLRKSRFLGEAGLIKNTSIKIIKSSDYKKGDLVKHPTFGIGRVQAVTKSGKDYKLKINFGSTKKEILSSFVKPI